MPPRKTDGQPSMPFVDEVAAPEDVNGLGFAAVGTGNPGTTGDSYGCLLPLDAAVPAAPFPVFEPANPSTFLPPMEVNPGSAVGMRKDDVTSAARAPTNVSVLAVPDISTPKLPLVDRIANEPSIAAFLYASICAAARSWASVTGMMNGFRSIRKPSHVVSCGMRSKNDKSTDCFNK